MKETPKLELFITDCHYPVDDPQVTNLELQVAKAFKPDILWLNGDVMDFKQVSRFRVNPREKLSLGEDIKYGRKRLSAFRDILPNARIFIKEGNHDRRFQHYVWDHAEELTGIEDLNLQALLRLQECDIEWIPASQKSKIGDLFHLHGDEVPTGSTFPARGMLTKVNVNTIFGHYHRFSVAHSNTLSGKTHVCHSIGCTQTLNVDFDFNPQWQQGFALIEYTKSGLFHINPIEVFREGNTACCLVAGKLFKSAV